MAKKQPPESRLNIKYDTTVNGVLKKKELPYKVLVMGDFSNGASDDAKVDYADREIRNIKSGVDQTLSDMNISLDLEVPNLISKQGGNINVNYKLNSMKDFKPDNIAEKVPEIKSLMMLKQNLISLSKEIENTRSLKKLLDSTFSNEEELNMLKSKIPNLEHYTLSDIDEEKATDEEGK
jgi:type VI secretion system protein ImpB